MYIAGQVAVNQCDNPAAHYIDVTASVGYHHHGYALAVQFHQQVEDVPNAVIFQIGGQLIQQKDWRAAHQGAGQLHMADVAKVQLCGKAFFHVLHTHQGQRFGHCLRRFVTQAAGFGGLQQIVIYVQLAD